MIDAATMLPYLRMGLGRIRVKDGKPEFLASAGPLCQSDHPIDPAIVAGMLRDRTIVRSCSHRPYRNIRFYTTP